MSITEHKQVDVITCRTGTSEKRFIRKVSTLKMDLSLLRRQARLTGVASLAVPPSRAHPYGPVSSLCILVG